ncbi:hypothetical protein H310_02667 [Aphanomyces invadans]|uniref:Uncharacterized protein n=1 Tax=Aphanomyces invadans TaxID=157072 RepID=A0A024UJF4_9STRA|nr:hypothetical protein H310_02667 [Aphanomyces invadans]ETW06394.1 hypothetical protein H310_02667 [Aphanomyces invadans]|eukprot:XP_008864469.1 hypothetical protein H310_02667 [Aphanomyces invadans]
MEPAAAGDPAPPGDVSFPKLHLQSPRQECGPADASDLELRTVRGSDPPHQDADWPSPRDLAVPSNLPTLVPPGDNVPSDRTAFNHAPSKPGRAVQFKTKARRRSNSLRSVHHAMSPVQASSTPVASLQRNRTMGSLHTNKVLTRLGVTSETMRLEKGMKKLGICDHDIQASIEIRRHCGVILSEPLTKEELLLGFSAEQLRRIKAIKTMGTSENEILDVYCKQISNLGIPRGAAATIP